MKVFNQKQLAMLLMGMGAVPFFVLALLMLPGAPAHLLPAPPALILHLYAVIIASFIAGLQWGVHFCKRTNDSVYIYSTLTVLLVWLSMLWAGNRAGFALVLGGFMLLWIIEYRFSVQRVTTAWFWRLRSIITAVVCACLLLAIVVA